MSERQVQYTDGFWSREVEVGDDLLDRALELADDYRNLDEGRVLRALVERVKQAEAKRDSLRFELDGARAVARKDNEHLIAERDVARGKLDKVRELADWLVNLADAEYGSPGWVDRSTVTLNEITDKARDVLAILDGTTGR